MKKLFLSLFALLLLCSCQSQFSKDGWSGDPDNRKSMVYDMLEKNELKGKQEDEIISLLGEPEQKIDEPVLQFVYYLGRAGLGVDDMLLVLQFDQNGKLESHKIRNS